MIDSDRRVSIPYWLHVAYLANAGFTAAMILNAVLFR